MSIVTPVSPDALLHHTAGPDTREQPAPARPATPLTVNAFLNRDEFAVAGALLRPGPAINLVPEPPMALMSLANDVLAATIETATGAGFDVLKTEMVPQPRLIDRLRRLDARPTLLVAAVSSVRQQRVFTRVVEGPVLALPGSGAPPEGPAVVPAADAWGCAGPVARALRTKRLVIVGPHTHEAAAGVWSAQELGLDVEVKVTSSPESLMTIVEELDGLLVTADGGPLLRKGPLTQCLEHGRPCLMVPAHGARR